MPLTCLALSPISSGGTRWEMVRIQKYQIQIFQVQKYQIQIFQIHKNQIQTVQMKIFQIQIHPVVAPDGKW